MGNLATPLSVQKLQAALHAKAKDKPSFRFYALYDKLYRADVLQYAYTLARANGGAPGVDGKRFEDIEAYGLEQWLGELAQELRTEKYEPEAIRRVYIPKPNSNKLRPLGIATIRDRVAMTAAVVVLGPVFESDLPSEQYGYRVGRSALDAVRQVHSLLNTGHTHIVDADLSEYYETIPHSELLQSVARRVVDRRVLHLIKMWITAPVEDTDERGKKKRTTRNRDEKRGLPQGSPLSPLLSNLYMRRFVLGWKRLGYERLFGGCIVTYADDLVICCTRSAEEALFAMRRIMQRLRLTVNEEKTHLCHVPVEHFDFLGYQFGRFYSAATGKAYLGTRPSKKSVRRLIGSIHELTAHRTCLLEAEVLVDNLNRKLRGWANYFKLGPVSKAYKAVDKCTTTRLRRWLRHKHRVRNRGNSCYSDEYLYESLGLIRLPSLTRNLPWAKA
ncbi:MAG: group II intron reverse transcriptase/maturase [Steroidobacteraceae bacterium]